MPSSLAPIPPGCVCGGTVPWSLRPLALMFLPALGTCCPHPTAVGFAGNRRCFHPRHPENAGPRQPLLLLPCSFHLLLAVLSRPLHPPQTRTAATPLSPSVPVPTASAGLFPPLSGCLRSEVSAAGPAMHPCFPPPICQRRAPAGNSCRHRAGSEACLAFICQSGFVPHRHTPRILSLSLSLLPLPE